MEKLGISDKFIKFVIRIYSSAKAKIRTTDGESTFFPILKGVLQGETLSRILFTIFMDDLMKNLNECNGQLRIEARIILALLYADDIVLLANNAFELQEKIEIIKKFLLKNGLIINLSKTNVVIF